MDINNLVVYGLISLSVIFGIFTIIEHRKTHKNLDRLIEESKNE